MPTASRGGLMRLLSSSQVRDRSVCPWHECVNSIAERPLFPACVLNRMCRYGLCGLVSFFFFFFKQNWPFSRVCLAYSRILSSVLFFFRSVHTVAILSSPSSLIVSAGLRLRRSPGSIWTTPRQCRGGFFIGRCGSIKFRLISFSLAILAACLWRTGLNELQIELDQGMAISEEIAFSFSFRAAGVCVFFNSIVPGGRFWM